MRRVPMTAHPIARIRTALALVALSLRDLEVERCLAARFASENSIALFMPRDVRTSTFSYCLGDSSRWRLANAGERSRA
jgi:hypothetical protein